MRLLTTICAAGLALSVAACGTKSSEENKAPTNKQPTAKEQQLEKEFAQIPGAAIVRVPVDAEGNATGEPEMRIYNGKEEMTDEVVDGAWDAAEAPEQVISSEDELDKDSSTQSWQGYHRRGGCHGGAWGRGCGRHFRHNYWQNTYRPWMYYRGHRWNYGYHRRGHFRRAGFRYYCYQPRRYW